MYKIKIRTASSWFLGKFEQPSHSYPTCFSKGNYRKPQIKLRKCRFWISTRGPTIWNDHVGSTEKENQSPSLFKPKIKSKLLYFENEVTYFNTVAFKKLTHEASADGNNVTITIVHSCLCFVSISRAGLDDKANWLSTGPSFKFRWANCLIFLFID